LYVTSDDSDAPHETAEQFSGHQHKPLNGEAIATSIMFNHDCAIQYPNHTDCYPAVCACDKLTTLPVNHMKTLAEFINDIFLQHTVMAKLLVGIKIKGNKIRLTLLLPFILELSRFPKDA
jgi:hypothetical protein